MNNVYTLTANTALTIGPPAIIFIVNPYMLYFVIFMFLLTCGTVCVSIIANCKRRNKRLDAIMTRAIRREHAKSGNE